MNENKDYFLTVANATRAYRIYKREQSSYGRNNHRLDLTIEEESESDMVYCIVAQLILFHEM